MEEWKKYKLGDILNFRRGHDLPKSEMRVGDIPVAGSNGIIGYHDTATPVSPCITIGRSGNVGTPYIYDICWAHNTVLYVDDFKGNNPLYLFYLLKTLPLSSFGGGSAVPTLNRNHIHPLLVRHTSNIKLQERIATLLKSLDDKIEVNSRINDNLLYPTLLAIQKRISLLRRKNDNLEQQAQALFKSWFVDFEPFKDGEFVESELGMIPKGWRVEKAEDVFDINIGKTPPRKEHEWFSNNEEDNVWVSIADMGDCGVFISDSSEYLTNDAIKRFNIQMVDKDSVLLSFKLTVGRVAIAGTRLTTNEAIARFALSNTYYREFLYLFLKQYKYDNLGSTSSIATAVNSKTIKGMKILIPSDSTIKDFSTLVKPLFNSIEILSKESCNLMMERDALLPRLMSGELKVNELNA